MAKRSRIKIEQVIYELGRSQLTHPTLSDRYFDSVRQDAIGYLSDLQDLHDQELVSDMGLAEVGAELRHRRERVAFLEGELKQTHRNVDRLESELADCRRQLREVGLL